MSGVGALHRQVLASLACESTVIVRVLRTQGSVPREAGTWMAVFAQREQGTIGGGHLELQAIQQARAGLVAGGIDAAGEHRFALGPSLGQCCGGVVWLGFELLPAHAGDAAQAAVNSARMQAIEAQSAPAPIPVALFGGGHVGKAIAAVLHKLPVSLHWIDSRDEIFPAELPVDVRAEHSDPVQAAVADLTPSSHVLIMSFSHAEDLEVVACCLQRQRERADLGSIGLIGSATKWASFRQRLLSRGFSNDELAQVTCPIGVPGITGKEPEVIAVAVCAQLLQRAELT